MLNVFSSLQKLKPLNVNAFPCWMYQLSVQFWRWHLQEIYVSVVKIAFWVICRYFPVFPAFTKDNNERNRTNSATVETRYTDLLFCYQV